MINLEIIDINFDIENTDIEINTVFLLAEKVYARSQMLENKLPVCDIIEAMYPTLDMETKCEIVDAYSYVMFDTQTQLH